MFYRKYAFSDGKKACRAARLADGAQRHTSLCEVIRSERSSEYCCYDMRYESDSSCMFQYIHSHPVQAGERVLVSA